MLIQVKLLEENKEDMLRHWIIRAKKRFSLDKGGKNELLTLDFTNWANHFSFSLKNDNAAFKFAANQWLLKFLFIIEYYEFEV